MFEHVVGQTDASGGVAPVLFGMLLTALWISAGALANTWVDGTIGSAVFVSLSS